MNLPVIRLKKGKENSLQRKHPWIFSGAIEPVDERINDGDLIELNDSQGNFLGFGFYQLGSISIKIISFEKKEINTDFFTDKIQNCLNFRKSIFLYPNEHTNVFRLVFGESDGLPGLIIDYYNGNCILQCHSVGMHKNIDKITEALKIIFKDNLVSVYDKSKESLPLSYSEKISNKLLFGSGTSTIVSENGHKFYIDWEKGQKTGFFIDQRENRLLLSQYSKNKKILNTFSYTGGFSVYAGASQAELITSVDVSSPAIAIAEKNITLNNINNHQAVVADTFDFLKETTTDYDIIILDPPAFAKNKSAKHNAVIGYKRLNSTAIKKIKPGGILFTFSCSQVIDKSLFYHTITAAAIEARRNVKVLNFLQQPADHPVSLFYPEGEYLKGMVLYVD